MRVCVLATCLTTSFSRCGCFPDLQQKPPAFVVREQGRDQDIFFSLRVSARHLGVGCSLTLSALFCFFFAVEVCCSRLHSSTVHMIFRSAPEASCLLLASSESKLGYTLLAFVCDSTFERRVHCGIFCTFLIYAVEI